MNQAKTKLMRTAQWLIVLAISLVVLPGNVFADKPVAPKSACDASCIRRCPCCLSKAPLPLPPAPLAPSSQSRVNVEKNFNLFLVKVALLVPAQSLIGELLVPESSVSASAGALLYQRHCIYLI